MKPKHLRRTEGVEIYDDQGQIPHIEGFKKTGENWFQRNAIIIGALGYAAVVTTIAAFETASLLRESDEPRTA